VDEQQDPVDAHYQDWIVRLEALYESVSFCCWHRLGDREVADEISAQVVAGLVGKPKIFKYFGLPFSGRVARLTERGIADAQNGQMSAGRGWAPLVEAIRTAPTEHREVLVLAWLDERDDTALAAELGCDVETAQRRREESLQFWQGVSADSIPSS
jgi:hypothetical protein